MFVYYSSMILKSRLILPLNKSSSVSVLKQLDGNLISKNSAQFQCIKEQRRYLLPKIMQSQPASGFDLPGQGLKKHRLTKEKESNSIVLTYLNRKIEEQHKGKKTFQLLPDYKFLISVFVRFGIFLFVCYLLLPDIKYLVYYGKHDTPSINPDYKQIKPDSLLVYVYLSLPLRFCSRIFGRLMALRITPFLAPYVIKSYAKFFDSNLEEAVESDVNYYKSLGQFFSRPIKAELRPISSDSTVVSPADGKVLICGKVNNGEVEQVKGVTYSLRDFLGPLSTADSDCDGAEFRKMSLERYSKSIMHDPVNNDLYQCVIYLAPGDYHGFHSPVEWVVKNRRHFPGELLSVNPKLAAWIKNLFVLNERVALSGEWKHGFFSMTAVGATMVGSVKIKEDLMLRTNQPLWKRGSFYDFEFPDQGMNLNKGSRVGEFKLGSTVVLVFEAPKNFDFKLESNQKLLYGEKISNHLIDSK